VRAARGDRKERGGQRWQSANAEIAGISSAVRHAPLASLPQRRNARVSREGGTLFPVMSSDSGSSTEEGTSDDGIPHRAAMLGATAVRRQLHTAWLTFY
jgi:hypothetical protein